MGALFVMIKSEALMNRDRKLRATEKVVCF